MNIKTPTFLLIVLPIFCLIACKTNPQEAKEVANVIESEVVENDLSEEIAPESEHKSPLRPNELLELGKIYSDTVKYVEFSDEGDEWMFIVEKGGKTIGIIDNNERKTNLVKGDELVINWKMDSIRYAGDDEFLDYTAFLVSSKKIAPVQLQDKKVKVLWRADQYDESLEMDVNRIILNEDYIKNISEPEKAALAYVATFLGNECEWDGSPNDDRSNLKCKILWALDLGYQCFAKHLDYLNHWFRSNKEVLKELENCPTKPDGGTIQSTFDEINVKVNGNEITVAFSASGINLRESESWTWNEKHVYEFNENELIVKEKEVSEKEFKTISNAPI